MKGINLFITIFLFSFCLSFAQKPSMITSKKTGWHKVGEITASFKQENESIVILGADKFKAIKLKVKDAPVNISVLQVFYETGEVETINLGNQLKAGEESNVINIKELSLSKITITYKTLSNSKNKKADLEVYGLK